MLPISIAPLVAVPACGSTSLDLSARLLAIDTEVSTGCMGSTPS
jgi:hypothetical protein